jgi:hypothetical protein
MRTTVPLVIAFISGLIMLLAFFFRSENTLLGNASQELLIWSSIISGFSFLLGAASIVRVNWSKVALRKGGWGYNLLTVISVFVMLIPALMSKSWLPASMAHLAGRDPGSIYDWIFTYVATPMSQTVFAVLAFYIASAAYRAFRARSAEATLLLITASLVMLWRVPMGEALLRGIYNPLPEWINTYVMTGINMSVQRGIVIGAALGAASFSLRILLGIERTYMGRG